MQLCKFSPVRREFKNQCCFKSFKCLKLHQQLPRRILLVKKKYTTSLISELSQVTHQKESQKNNFQLESYYTLRQELCSSKFKLSCNVEQLVNKTTLNKFYRSPAILENTCRSNIYAAWCHPQIESTYIIFNTG